MVHRAVLDQQSTQSYRVDSDICVSWFRLWLLILSTGSPNSDPVNLQKLVELQLEDESLGDDRESDPIFRMSKKDLIDEVARLRKTLQGNFHKR
jgi:hypothetical protein